MTQTRRKLLENFDDEVREKLRVRADASAASLNRLGQLAQLSDEVGPDRTLLVLCAAFRAPKAGPERYPNLTVKKIPKAVLARCEWGRDDYSLKVENLPKAPAKPGQQELNLG